MSLYKRKGSDYFWFKMMFDGQLVQKSTKVKNKRAAEKIEAAYRTRLANAEVGIEERKKAPTLREFAQRFIDFVATRNANKPKTIKFYSDRLKNLLKWEPLREARLDRIDESLIERYIALRRPDVGICSVNNELRTLRRALNVATQWKVILRSPKVRLLPGEASREYVLTKQDEQAYLAACPPLLRDIATLLLDSGLRIGEALSLRWSDVQFEPTGNARTGHLKVTDGKSRNARRAVPLTERVRLTLTVRKKEAKSEWVFPGDPSSKPLLGTSVAHMHARVCRPLQGKRQVFHFPREFVLHSMRHTFLTRVGESGTDMFTLMKVAGHSSVTVSQRYVHPTGESVQLAFDRLEELNQKALEVKGQN